ncbi:NitT/TauT family transport system permease protein [Rhizobium sp. SG_E_25_P2]|uniref:ABC transporter permease n=1 Tax=Rhizobium sp. SG_E_25_P2 TaxID=2879942 RepID=UPI0024737589|nr:ABC transporter permease subunit [Rhizobium sp. SG_E_25_P2]MDH6268164.1 NitT/TauT family transport system permease protein [Rhizobium sp. SG_E_25_P2]
MAHRLMISTVAPVTLAVLALFFLWQGATWLFDVPAYILPKPLDIFAGALARKALLGKALYITFAEALLGFLLGALVGLAAAVAMILLPLLERMLLPLFVALNSVPTVAFVPLALIWFGLGMGSKIAIAAFAVSFAMLLNALDGLKRPEPASLDLLRSFGAGPFGILWRLRLPVAMPAIVTGLRIGLARSTITVIVTEMLGAYSGIGQVIYQSTSQINYIDVWAAVLVSSFGSLVLYGLLVAIDRKLVWWR